MALAVLMFYSCSKETDSFNQLKPKTLISGLNVSVQNGMLFFPDAIEYSNFIERDIADSVLTVLGGHDGFTSCFEWMESNEVNFMGRKEDESEIILKLLNKDGLVHIQNKVYRINALTETVYMIDSSRAGSPAAIAALIAESGDGVTSESVDRDLFELNGLPTEKSGCPTIGSNRSNSKSKIASKCTSPFSGVLNVEVKYIRYGIYFEMFSKVQNPDFNSSYFCNNTQLISNPAYYIKNGSSVPFNEISNHTYPNYARKNWYQGSKRLCSFWLKSKARINAQNIETEFAEIRFNH